MPSRNPFSPWPCPNERGFLGCWACTLKQQPKLEGGFWLLGVPARAGGLWLLPVSSHRQIKCWSINHLFHQSSGISLHAVHAGFGVFLVTACDRERPPFLGCSFVQTPMGFLVASHARTSTPVFGCFGPAAICPKTGGRSRVIFPCGKARTRARTGDTMNRNRNGRPVGKSAEPSLRRLRHTGRSAGPDWRIF